MVIDVVGGSLWVTEGFVAHLHALQGALAMLGRNLVNQCTMLTNGVLLGLTVNLVPEGKVGIGYGPLMKGSVSV